MTELSGMWEPADLAGGSTELTGEWKPAGLPEYSGELALCDACGFCDAKTEYVPSDWFRLDRGKGLVNLTSGPAGSFLKRTCERCGFEWAESQVSWDDQDPGPVGVDQPASVTCQRCQDTGKDPVDYPHPCQVCTG